MANLTPVTGNTTVPQWYAPLYDALVARHRAELAFVFGDPDGKLSSIRAALDDLRMRGIVSCKVCSRALISHTKDFHYHKDDCPIALAYERLFVESSKPADFTQPCRSSIIDLDRPGSERNQRTVVTLRDSSEADSEPDYSLAENEHRKKTLGLPHSLPVGTPARSSYLVNGQPSELCGGKFEDADHHHEHCKPPGKR